VLSFYFIADIIFQIQTMMFHRIKSTTKNQIHNDSHRKKRNYVNKPSLLGSIITMITIATAPQSAQAQVQICSCSPPTYYWTLDFSKGCPLTITGDGGTKGGFCSYDNEGPNHDGDYTPVVITDFTFLDLDSKLIGIKGITVTDTSLVDGDVIEYESITSFGDFTGGVQGTFVARNAAGHQFTLDFLVRFSNLCERLPFNVGDALGYLKFVSTKCSTWYTLFIVQGVCIYCF
jgi:hypothetical protein